MIYGQDEYGTEEYGVYAVEITLALTEAITMTDIFQAWSKQPDQETDWYDLKVDSGG